MAQSKSKVFINVLLLGETGVGKSTFINALGNYFLHHTLEEAKQSGNLLYFVPAKFTLTDDDFKQRVISVGNNSNEVQTPGASATQDPRSYVFDFETYSLRIIDTPGMGDTRGIQYDEINADKLLNYISQLDHLNAICIMLQPNNSRLSVLFEFCLKHILARLDKQVQSNILFLYTNARTTFFSPGDTHKLLKKLLEDISSKATIPYNINNTFCIDNEAFRYLVASSQGINFTDEEREHYGNSWTQSVKTCQRLINYIVTLPKIPLMGTITINESRRIIGRLVKPVGEMIVHIEKALTRLQEHEAELKDSNLSVQQLQEKLYIPVTKFTVNKRTSKGNSFGEGFTAGVGYSIPDRTVSFNIGYQKQRQSSEVVEEVMVPYEEKVVDQTVQSRILSSQNAGEIAKQQVEKTSAVIKEYIAEANFLVDAAAKFTTFLEENAIVAYSDVFEAHFVDILQRERSIAGAKDSKLVKNLEELLRIYRDKKRNVFGVTPNDIYEVMDGLFALKNGGAELRQFYEKLYDFEDNESYNFKVNESSN